MHPCKPGQSGLVSRKVLRARRAKGDAMVRILIGAIGLCVMATCALAAEPVEIGIGYLRHAGVRSTLSLVAQPADNDGIDGARLAIEDNNTTGKFLNQHFTLEELRLKDGDDPAKAAVALADRKAGF